jgi:hypothetical protein
MTTIMMQDHVPNKVASMYFGGVNYRMNTYIPEGLTDDQLSHYVYEGYYIYEYYTNPINFRIMADEAKKYNMFLTVNNNINYGIKQVNPVHYGRVSGFIADRLDALNLRGKSAIYLFNEPGDYWKLNESQYCQYVRESDKRVGGRYPLIIINDEYHRYNEQSIFTNLADIKSRLHWGVHHLSSLDATMNNIRDAKTQANSFGVPLWNTESGSWYVSYRTAGGHNINLEIMAQCKQYEYKSCAIVCVDVNEYGANRWKNLGYRVWDNSYSTLKILSPYWADFENQLKNYKEELLMEYLRPLVQQAFYNAMGWGDKPYHNNTPSLPIAGRKVETNPICWADLDAVFETLTKGLVKSLADNGALGAEFPKPMDIKYLADGTYNNNWRTIANSNPEGS